MNLGQLRTAVDRRTGIAVDTTTQNEWINDVLQSVALEDEWPWLRTTQSFSFVASQNAYTLPSTCRSVLAVFDSNGNRYDPAAQADLDTYSTSDVSIAPQFGDGGHFYAVTNTTIYIVPTPTASSGTFTVRYIQDETTLSVDGDTPLIPAAYQRSVVELVALLTMERRGTRIDTVRAKGYADVYNDLISKMRKQALPTISASRVPRIRPGSGW